MDTPRFRPVDLPSYNAGAHFMVEAGVERRLAAILAADVAGYSRLTHAYELGMLEGPKAHRREVIDPAIASHKGWIVKTTGDGMLVEFASAVDAVTCAMAVQHKIAERNVASRPAMTFRIGINVGEIIIDGEDVFLATACLRGVSKAQPLPRASLSSLQFSGPYLRYSSSTGQVRNVS
jgi:class 3 adenylate cyclase